MRKPFEGVKTPPQELHGLIMFNQVAYQTVASKVPVLGTLDHKPLKVHFLASGLLCMVRIPETGIQSI